MYSVFCALSRSIKFFRRPTNALGCMNVILLCSNHQHFLATHVAILRVVRTRIQIYVSKCCVIQLHSYVQVHFLVFFKKCIHFIKYLTCYSSHLDVCKMVVFIVRCVLLNSLALELNSLCDV